MESSEAIAVLAALAQPTRLNSFRLLVVREPDGLAAGELARLAGVPQNTMSAHLSVLARAGLVRGERQSRSIVYRANLGRVRELTMYLVRDCCGGTAAVCSPLIDELSACCTPERAMNQSLVIAAVAPHCAELREALLTAGLPVDDLEEPGRRFFRFDSGEGVVGYGGFELYGEAALVRSVVVLPHARGQGRGRQLAEALLQQAHAAGARRAYLLTTTAAPFFAHLGFVPIPREEAPADILSTRQATTICSSAPLMTRAVTAAA